MLGITWLPPEVHISERLHRLTDGVPIIVQNLWQDWRRTNAVFQNDAEQWEMDHESSWVEYGSGRDYIRAMLDQLWPHEEETPWSAEQMVEMLALASQEGTSFTVEALAKAFDVETEKLVMGLEYLLDEPDDPGLIKEAAPVILEMPSANWKHILERFEFSPLLVWFTLTTYEKPDPARLDKYAEGLRDSAHPFVERFASKIAYLYEQANQPEFAKKYHRLTNENNTLRKLMAHAELLLEFHKSSTSHSRLIEIVIQLNVNSVACNFPSWAPEFASRLIEIFEKSKSRDFLGIALGLLGHSKMHLGDYPAARGYYEKKLALEEEVGSKGDIANTLGGLGHVASSLGDYPAARGYYEKQLALEEKVGRKDGIAGAFFNLGNIAHSLGEHQIAREYYGKKLAIDRELGRKHGIANALRGLGDVAQSLGNPQAAREYYGQALEIEEKLERKNEIAETVRGLGDVANSFFEYQVARGYYERTLNIFEDIGSPKSKAVMEEIKKLDEVIKRSKHESET